jgi:SAM-dependent methyltransferase
LAAAFGTYHTMDLNRKDADFREDLQALSFADGSYDCVVSSRVLHLPADFTACVREMRRVLRPNGMAIISENYARETTIEYDDVNLGRRVRGIGLNAIQIYREVFGRVDLYWSDRYDQRYQLVNTMVLNGLAKDDYPDAVRVPNVGYKDVVAVCHALPQDR